MLQRKLHDDKGFCLHLLKARSDAHFVFGATPVNVLQATSRQDSLALLSVGDAFVLDRTHTQHLWHQPVELIKAAPRTCKALAAVRSYASSNDRLSAQLHSSLGQYRCKEQSQVCRRCMVLHKAA